MKSSSLEKSKKITMDRGNEVDCIDLTTSLDDVIEINKTGKIKRPSHSPSPSSLPSPPSGGGSTSTTRKRTSGTPKDQPRKKRRTTEASTEEVRESSRGEVAAFVERRTLSQLGRVMVEHMEPYCRVENVGFEDFSEAIELLEGMSIKNTVQLVLTDPPYNTRSERNLPNSCHDSITVEEMRRCVELFAEALRPGGHGLIFCAMLQFHHWYELLSEHECEMEDVEEERQQIGQVASATRTFHVEPIAKFFLRSPGCYNSHPGMKRLSHTSMVEQCVHFWKPCGREGFEMVDYNSKGHIPSRFPGWTNVMDNIPRMERTEVIMTTGENGKKTRLRPEQKSISMMKELIEMFTKPEDTVMDLFAGTCSVAKACLSLAQPRKFIGCEQNEKCFHRSMVTVIETYIDAMMNEESEVKGSVEAIQDGNSFMRVKLTGEGTVVSGKAVWRTPKGLPEYQVFPFHIRSYLSSLGRDDFFIRAGSRMMFSEWPVRLQSFLNGQNVESLLAVDAIACNLSVRPSTIKHPMAGDGVFATTDFNVGDEIAKYYGTLVFEDMRTHINSRVKGSGMMAVSKERFLTRGMTLRKKSRDVKNEVYTTYIVAAPFCVAGKLNDARYVVEDLEYSKKGRPGAREANVEFVEIQTRASSFERTMLRNSGLVKVVATKRIERGDELFADYGATYAYWGWDAEGS